MRFKPFLNFLSGAWKKRQPLRKKRVESSHTKPLVELLERRDLLTAPTILSTGVLPVDGSNTPTGTPIIQVQYSETMTSSALAQANYVLLGSSGNVVPINSVNFVAFGAAPPNSVVQLSYNGGAQLVVDTYTLFVRGQNLIDQNEGLPMAQPGQLVVGNAGKNNIAVVNIPGDGTLGALSNYNLPTVGTTLPNPNAVAFDDFDGDNIKDLVVVKAGTDEMSVYLGRTASNGGGFGNAPNLTLALPASAVVNQAHAIATGDLNNDNKKDIVITNFNNNSISVFLNTSTTQGIAAFGAATNTTVDTGPVGLVLADFDKDTNLDIVVAVNSALTDLSAPADTVNDYRINLLPGTGNGGLGTMVPIRIGDVTPTGISNPTSIAAGRINNDTLDDLVIGSTVGAFYLRNTSTGAGNFGFTVTTPAVTTASVLSVAIGKMDADNNNDIVVATAANTIEVIKNNGGATPTFVAPAPIAVAAGTSGGLALGDLDNNNRLDIVVGNNAAAGLVTVLRNDSQLTGAITTATATAGLITITTAADHGLITGDQVTIAGVAGFAGALGTFTITVVDSTHFTLNGTNTTGSGTGGTFTSANVSIVSRGTFSVDGTPRAVALGDTNQDGFLDVVTANNTGNDFSLLLGRGDGRLQESANTALTPTTTSSVALGDVNRDGIVDIVAANYSFFSSATVSVMLGQVGGTFAAPVNYQFPGGGFGINGVVAIAVGDVNGDARPDILAVDSFDNEVGIMINNITVAGGPLTGGSFASAGSAGTDRGPNSIAVADLNKDGKLDLVVGHNGQGGGGPGGGSDRQGVNVIFGNGNGTFQDEINYDNNTGMSAVVIGDFNRDGNLDFIAAEDAAPGNIWVHYGDGAGSFTSFGNDRDGFGFGTSVPNPTSIAASDFNGDGFLDVVVTSGSASQTNAGVAILLNQLGTGFGAALQTDVIPGTSLQSVVANDVNQDGFVDAIVGTRLNSQGGGIQDVRNAGGLVEIRATQNHNLQTGDQVTIAGVNGTVGTAANGTWTITVTSQSRFTLNTSTFSGNYSGGGTWTKVVAGVTNNNNIYVLIGNGDGTFKSPVPYLAGGTGLPAPAPSYLIATSSPLIRVTTFTSGGTIVATNVINNGNFESRDLSGEQGNLLGWNTYKLPASPGGSHGGFGMQSNNSSPLSGTTVTQPTGKYAAMLDQPDLVPYTEGNNTTNPNNPSTYEGTHVIYQDVTIPANVTSVRLSLGLYINNTDNINVPAYSDPNVTSSLDYRTAVDNQQVRVDIMGTHPITDASNPTTGPIVITSPDHGLFTGQQIQILGVEGNTGANGFYIITRVDANRFSLNGSIPTGVYTAGGYWTRMLNVVATRAISDATNPLSGPIVIKSAAHGLVTGSQIQVFGVQGNSGANGIFTVTVIDVDHFSLNNSNGTGLYTNGGAWSLASNPGDVLRNLFITSPSSSTSFSPQITDNNLLAYAGQTIRLRIASANNRGRLIVSVDNVRITPQFSDTISPTLGDLGVRNPSFFAGTAPNLVPHTVDPTIVGVVDDNSGINGVSYVEFDLNNNGFGGADDVKTTVFDATGRFSYTIANPKLGNNKIGVRVVDRAGNTFSTTYEFFVQANSVTEWQPIGPQGIDVSGQGVDYTKVSGRVTTTISDLNDPTGNTYFVGSANGGIWKSTDGGFDWTPVTNNVKVNGVDQFVPIGSIAQSRSNPHILYAGTGVGDQQLGSQPGVGVLKSVDGGTTWTVIGDSNIVMASARATKVVVDNDNPDIAYIGVAVDATGTTGAVYKTINGGLTWTNVLLGQNMFRASGGTVGAGARLPSVTDLIIDPFNANRLLIGLGNIGLVGANGAITISTGDGTNPVVITTAANHGLTTGNSVTIAGIAGFAAANGTFTITVISPTQFSLNGNTNAGNGTGGAFSSSSGAGNAGLWRTTTKGAVWDQIVGGDGLALPAPDTIPNSTIPTGASIGRVTIAMGSGRTGDERYVYVMMSSVPGNNSPPSVDWGSFTQGPGGLYRSTDNMLNFTKVMLRQDFNPAMGFHNFVDINLMAHDAANTGALIVDPTNPNVVYVGGSEFWRQPTDGPNHNLIRVDTGNMQDTTFRVAGAIINNGDDRDKAAEGRRRAGFYDNVGMTPTTTDPYTGEGVYWYNLTENTSGRSGQITSLPSQISALAFDSQGRLLVGTSGGIWRGVSYGFGYDDTSGNTGILRQFGGFGGGGGGNTSFTTPGMTFTAINGNLQIADMTSVAIDPQNRGVYYTTQYGTGVAGSTQPLVWVSQGLTGPIVNGVDLNIPNAASVLVANPPAGAPADTPITLFRIWQFADNLSLSPETSSDNGTTWSSVSAPGISVSGNSAGFFPGFAVNPTTFILSGVPQNQLLFGTDKVYLSSTSGAVWDPLPTAGAPVSSAGGLISTMAFSPSDPNTYYLGTNLGEVFIFSPAIGAGWVQRGAGVLPTTKVNGIAVDPSDPNKVFALFDGNTGAMGHVWYSDDAGATWTDVSGSLPNAPAYAMVIDPTENLGAPNGKIYVSTQVGVFYSVNGGSNWLRLGLGMPNVPVVDLKYSPNLQVLAAATLGRGVFTINTSTLSFIPDQVIDEDQTVEFPFSVNDAGNSSFSLTATSDNQALIPTGNIFLSGTGTNRKITFTPALHANTPANGVANITIKLTSGAFVATQSFQVTVNFINYPPSVSNLPTQVTLKNTPLTINFSVTDVETAAGSLTVAATSSDTTVVPNLPANLVLGGAGATRTLTINPAAGAIGSTTISITVTDDDGGLTTKTFDLLVTQIVTLPFSDNFNRANSIFLGPGWNVNSGSFVTKTSMAQAGTLGGIASLNQLSAADVSLQADVSVTLGQDIGLLARYSGTGTKNYYFARMVSLGGSSFRAEIAKNVNGTVTVLAASAPIVLPTPPVGAPPATKTGTLRFEVVGTSLKLFLDDDMGGPLPANLVAYANDSTFSAPGTAGLVSLLGNATADNFSISAITLLTPNLPFTDDFTQADNSQLSRNWLDRAGNFSVLANRLVANDAGAKLNVATVNGVRTNTSVQADINLATNQEAGLIARYNASGYYYAQLFYNGTKTTAGIYRVNAAGAKTLLSNVVDVTNVARIRFEAVGPSLRLYFDNDVAGPNTAVQVLHAYDFNFSTGMNGVRASKNAVIDNFVQDAINLLTPTLPFNETFLQADGPLSRNWNDKAGNFVVASNVLRGSGSGISMAMINGVLTNGSIQADYMLGNAVNQQVGVIARYSTSATNPILNTYYLAQIIRTSTGAQAKIFKVSENTATKAVTMTQLGATANVATGAGTVRLEVAGPSLKLFYGPTALTMTLATYAFDSGYASGTFGIRASTDTSSPASNATQISGVTLDAIVLTTPPSYPFTDDFTQTTGSPLSRNWTERQGNFSVNAGAALVANDNGTSLATVNGVLTNSSIQADVFVAANQQAGLILRYQANGSYYFAQIRNVTTTNATTQLTTSKTTLTIFKVVGTTLTQLAAPVTIDLQTVPVPGTITYTPFTLRFEAAGTNLKAFQGPVGGLLTMRAFAYDASLPASGFDGIRSSKNATFDNVVVDQITLLTPNLPFNDTFTQDDLTQLSRNWDERSGNFTAQGNALVATGTTNQATVHGVSLSDVSLTADVIVGATQQGGLIARYTAISATKDQYYFARIVAVTGGFKAEILKKAASGTTTTIRSVPVATGAGTLNFQVTGANLKLFYNGTLVAFGYDTAPLGAGSVGIRATKNVVVDSFSADAVTLNTPALPFTDSFGLLDNSQLSTNWLERSGNFSIVGGALTVGNLASTSIATVNGTIAESAGQADIVVDGVNGQQAGLVARYSSSGYYLARVFFNGTNYQAAIYRVVGATLTAVTTPITVASGTGTLRFEVAGPSLKLFYGPDSGSMTLIANGYNTSFVTGTSGVLLSKGASTIDNYSLNAITLTTPTLPFTDAFTQPDSDPISRNWTERAGLFQISGNALGFVNASSTNTATVNGLTLANAAVQADVITGTGSGQQAGLIARYSSAGYYLAVVRATSIPNQYVPQIYRVVNGVATRLDVPAAAAFNYGAGPTAGTIRLEVAGTSLKLYFGPVGGPRTLRAFGNDTVLSGTGTVGVSTIGSTVDNFNVTAITLLTPSLPFSDPFTQADGSQLSLNWVSRAGNFSVLGNLLFGNANSNLATVNGVNVANALVDIDVNVGLGQFAGGVARYSISPTGTVSYYFGRIASVALSISPTGYRAEIWKQVGSTATLLAKAPVAAGTGVVRFQVTGTNLKLLFGATSSVLNLATYAYDSSLTTGATGVVASKNSLVDNFTTNSILLPVSQPLPYSETFPANGPTHQLSSNWLERAGNFTFDTVANRIIGKAASNIATLSGLSATDIDVQGTFGLTSLNQSAGLISRYQNSTNMYYATITLSTGGFYTVRINKVVNGVTTVIGQATSATFNGTFRFQTVGTTMRVFLDNSPTALLTVTDTSISAAGLVGFRTNLGVQAQTFSAI